MIIMVKVESIQELRQFAQDVVAGQVAVEHTEKKAAKKPNEKEERAVQSEPGPEPAVEPEVEVDEATVKALLTRQLKAGKKDEIKALFDEYGVAKLSELLAKQPEKLAEFYAKAEAI